MSWGLASDVGEAGHFRRIETHPWLGSYIKTLLCPTFPNRFSSLEHMSMHGATTSNKSPQFPLCLLQTPLTTADLVSQESRGFIPGCSGQSPKEGHVASIYSLEMCCFSFFFFWSFHLLPVSFWGWRRHELRCTTPVLLPLQTRV